MPIQMRCPKCATKVMFSDQALGKRVRCSKCAEVFQAAAPSASSASSASSAPSASDTPASAGAAQTSTESEPANSGKRRARATRLAPPEPVDDVIDFDEPEILDEPEVIDDKKVDVNPDDFDDGRADDFDDDDDLGDDDEDREDMPRSRRGGRSRRDSKRRHRAPLDDGGSLPIRRPARLTDETGESVATWKGLRSGCIMISVAQFLYAAILLLVLFIAVMASASQQANPRPFGGGGMGGGMRNDDNIVLSLIIMGALLATGVAAILLALVGAGTGLASRQPLARGAALAQVILVALTALQLFQSMNAVLMLMGLGGMGGGFGGAGGGRFGGGGFGGGGMMVGAGIGIGFLMIFSIAFMEMLRLVVLPVLVRSYANAIDDSKLASRALTQTVATPFIIACLFTVNLILMDNTPGARNEILPTAINGIILCALYVSGGILYLLAGNAIRNHIEDLDYED